MIRSAIETFIIGMMVALAGCAGSGGGRPPVPPDSTPDLRALSADFVPEVVTVADGVHVAVGFGLANSILLEGDDGAVIVDAMESAEAATRVKAAFARLSRLPVKAIFYTHFHADHTFGGRVMAGNDQPPVYAHRTTADHLRRVLTITQETTYRRAMRQFGTLLPPDALVNAGIGPKLDFDDTRTPAILMPTRTFSEDSYELQIAGVRLILAHAPGETPDQIFIWLPDKKILLPADNFYKSFPNLYAIRGTAYRDVLQWVASLDKMRALEAEIMIPSHGRPVIGAGRVRDALTDYRDAIQYVHDQTVRLMNAGLGPEDIVEQVRLPQHLASRPYLKEYYGTVAWSVRAIFDGYLGWFGGNATDLFPLSPEQRARRMARLAGGSASLLAQARQALAEEDTQWALELSDSLLRLDPGSNAARQVCASALTRLGQAQATATARNYYLTQALEAEGRLVIGSGRRTISSDLLALIPLKDFFASMAVHLDPQRSAETDTVAGFRFPDTGEAYTVHVRQGVAEIQPRFPEAPDISLTVDSLVWKEVAAGVRSPAITLFKDIDQEGGLIPVVSFLRLFQSE